MAKSELLDRAYEALAVLSLDGATRVSISAVAKRAGISRSTINQAGDGDWLKLREDIRIRAAQTLPVGDQIRSLSISELRRRVKHLEEQVELLRAQAAKTYSQLIDRVQYYFALSGEAPKIRSEKAKLIQEITRLTQQNRNMKAQLELALANSESPAIPSLIVKRVIRAVEAVAKADIGINFLSKLDEFKKIQSSSSVVDIYLLCGLPFSGGEEWITEHRPPLPGVTLYIECNCVSRDVRGLLVALLHREFKANINCVRLRASKEACLSRAVMQVTGAEQVLVVKSIETLSDSFDEICLDESFNSIVLA